MRTLTALALPAVAALTLAGCSGSADRAATTSPVVSSPVTGSAATSANPTSGAAGPLVVESPWAKAAASGMSAVFGTIRNTTDQPVTLLAASTPASTVTQLHVTRKDASGAMVMQEAKEGFTIPAHGTLELRPGGNHIMLMSLTKPLLSGESVTVTLNLKGRDPVQLVAPVRAYSGAKETYAPGASASPTGTSAMSDMPGMSHAPAATPSAAARQ